MGRWAEVGHQVVGHRAVGHAGFSCCCSAGLCQSSFEDEAKKRKQFGGNLSYLVIFMCLARFCGQRPLAERKTIRLYGHLLEDVGICSVPGPPVGCCVRGIPTQPSLGTQPEASTAAGR